MNQPEVSHGTGGVLSIILSHFWFKCLGTMAFTSVFFMAYLFLLKHPFFPVTVIPATGLDGLIGIAPLALVLYLSLWLYLSLPVMLTGTRPGVVDYGLWVGAMCLTALTIFLFWPTAVPPALGDWAQQPGMAFLKDIDAAGNACPSLHVATAVFACFWINRQLGPYGGRRGLRALNIAWCVGIVYSTMATKQHMALDVVGGIALASAFALARHHATRMRAEPAVSGVVEPSPHPGGRVKFGPDRECILRP
ncbi:phosphatase PAP2 family protein [Parasulfuritortus cantonensis]|uniref:phosphatase PAP2 family protein n=1 Tax=Parasulfuritortus cantonensis TaxID=2528202 RepID=UPI00197FCCC8|nr:phosphatase PAP2 family protein [Parasulfuritortus cantonensis]